VHSFGTLSPSLGVLDGQRSGMVASEREMLVMPVTSWVPLMPLPVIMGMRTPREAIDNTDPWQT
jgi:hypothetical protein